MNRQENDRTLIILFVLLLPMVIWLALICAGSYEPDIKLFGLIDNITNALNEPMNISFNEYSLKTVLVFVFLYVMGIGVYFSSRENHRPGIEYGSAKWGVVSSIVRRYENRKDKSQNLILSQNMRIGLNAKKHRRNLNVLIIGGILEEVQNGLGYGEANGKAQAVICKAVIENQTDGFGYADLMSIARNSIFQYRDMYLRPEYYAQVEENLKLLLSDLITEVENGIKDYDTVRKEAYIKILQYADPSFSLENVQGDFCYLDIPAAPSAYFNRARKLLQNAVSRHAQNKQ